MGQRDEGSREETEEPLTGTCRHKKLAGRKPEILDHNFQRMSEQVRLQIPSVHTMCTPKKNGHRTLPVTT
jgi:hypothetical protein